MQIELLIDGKKKLFTAPIVPMLAKRKYLEIEAKAAEREDPITIRQQLDEDVEILSIISNVIFNNQFTNEQLLEGASEDYFREKLHEAVFGIKPKKKAEEGNNQGE